MSELAYTIKNAEAVTTVADYMTNCVDVPKFLACCQQCPSYKNNWSCPPFEFDVMKLWEEYKTLRLFARFLIPKEGCDGQTLIDSLWMEKEEFLAELLELEKATPGSMALSCGTCKACAVCARKNGKPCCQPVQMRHSIEALGGDVDETARRFFGKPLLWVKDGVAPDYLMLVGGLLLREDQ